MKRFQFSLRGLLLLVVVVALICGAISYHFATIRDLREQLENVSEMERQARNDAALAREDAAIAREFLRPKSLIQYPSSSGVGRIEPRRPNSALLRFCIEGLGDENLDIRISCLIDLAQMGKESEAAAPAIIDALEHDDDLRPFVAHYLGLMPWTAEQVVAAALRNGSPIVRKFAEIAIQNMRRSLSEEQMNEFLRKLEADDDAS